MIVSASLLLWSTSYAPKIAPKIRPCKSFTTVTPMTNAMASTGPFPFLSRKRTSRIQVGIITLPMTRGINWTRTLPTRLPLPDAAIASVSRSIPPPSGLGVMILFAVSSNSRSAAIRSVVSASLYLAISIWPTLSAY